MSGSGIALVFPGQGSQSAGMLADFAGNDKRILETYTEASEVLGFDLWDLTQQGPESELNRTEITQPALLTAGVAIWRLWQTYAGRTPDYMAGHSLGEYTALVCAGSIEFTDAVTLVRDRGRYMQEAVPEGTGAMAAVLGLDSATVEKICVDAADGGIVSAANYNSPEQTVIAGEHEAVLRAVEEAKASGAKRVIILPVSVPSHCLLMKTAADRLATRLNDISIRDTSIPVIHNVDAESHVTAEEIKTALMEQLYRPVRWVDTIMRLADLQCGTIIESGPGRVLSGLIKRIDRNMEISSLNDFDTFRTTVEKYSHDN
ncbi:MAG: ACP S-malonyltransferase [Gammaproteobacteria bacterium]